jgi:hypothetical protein
VTLKSLPYAPEFGKNFSLEEKQHFVINQGRRPHFTPMRKIAFPDTFKSLIGMFFTSSSSSFSSSSSSSAFCFFLYSLFRI